MTMPLLEAPRKPKWIPKKWHVRYDQMVLMQTLGNSNEEIANHFGCTPQQVSNICNTPQAAITRRLVLEKLQEKAIESIPKRMEVIAEKAVQRLHSVIHNDELFQVSPFAVVDRGVEVLKAVGIMKSDKGVNIEKAVILTAEQSSDLLDGLKVADRARQLNQDKFEIVVNAEPDN